MRFLVAAAISLSLGLFVTFADDKSDRADKLARLKNKFAAEYADFEKRLSLAESPADARGIQTEMRELVAITADKAIDIAKDDPKDVTGFEAADFVIQSAGKARYTGKEVDAALEIITEHHVANPKVKHMLPAAIRLGAGGEKLLKAVSENGADKDTKAVALYLRGYRISQLLDNEEDDAKLKTMAAEAIAFIEKAVTESPGAKIAGVAIGESAKKELENLKSVTALAVGSAAPNIESYTLDGKAVKLSDYKGKVVLVDLWATWCPPCRAMIPHEREMVKNMEKDKKPFVLVSVSADDKKEDLEKFLEKEPMPWVHWWDSGAENPVLKKFRVRAFPTLYLIDHTGVIRNKWVGKPDNDKLDKAVDELVKEALKAKG